MAAVLDLFSRRVVGWSMSAHMTAQLVTDALTWRLAPRQARDAAASLRSRQPIHQRTVPAPAGRPWHYLQHEPGRQRVGQCRHGELLLLAQDRMDSAETYRTRDEARPMCSITSSASIIPGGGTRHSAISPPRVRNAAAQLRMLSTKPGAGQSRLRCGEANIRSD